MILPPGVWATTLLSTASSNHCLSRNECWPEVALLVVRPPLAGGELLELALERLLDNPRRVRVALEQGLGHVLGLLETDVRWQRRHLGIGYGFVEHGPVGRERLIPGVSYAIRRIHPNTLEPEQLREAGVGEVGDVLRGL